jgi:hypothetical protein
VYSPRFIKRQAELSSVLVLNRDEQMPQSAAAWSESRRRKLAAPAKEQSSLFQFPTSVVGLHARLGLPEGWASHQSRS